MRRLLPESCAPAKQEATIHRTPNPKCPACQAGRLHSAGEWMAHHPDAGHGFTPEAGWTKPELRGTR